MGVTHIIQGDLISSLSRKNTIIVTATTHVPLKTPANSFGPGKSGATIEPQKRPSM